MAILKNLTPHPIRVFDRTGDLIMEIPPEEKTLRLSEIWIRVGTINGIPLMSARFGEPNYIPPKIEGLYYIVSDAVKRAFPDRDDFIVPSERVKDATHTVFGCKSFRI